MVGQFGVSTTTAVGYEAVSGASTAVVTASVFAE